MRTALKWLLLGVSTICLLCALAAAGAYLYLRQSLPKVAGELHLSGLNDRVEILRDAYGIPHIYARSVEDAHFALGFVHAQDRLWQMEMSRRIGAGRLAEILGPTALEADRFTRTLGVRRAAAANLRNYDGPTKAVLEAYAAGINAFLAGNPVLPPEFWLLRVSPEPWTPLDSVTWTKMMAWDLGGNWRSELLRMRLAKTLPIGRIQEFLAPYPGDAPASLPELKELYGKLERQSRELADTRSRENAEGTGAGTHDDSGLGSNNWVVGGARSASGKPLLANDPHLGLTAPPVWYLAHLNAPGIDVIGATLPGVPGIVLGRNERIAWAFTNTGPDVQDLYIEKIDSAGNYVTPEGPRPFAVFAETIKVKGAAAEQLKVRVSRHSKPSASTRFAASRACKATWCRSPQGSFFPGC